MTNKSLLIIMDEIMTTMRACTLPRIGPSSMSTSKLTMIQAMRQTTTKSLTRRSVSFINPSQSSILLMTKLMRRSLLGSRTAWDARETKMGALQCFLPKKSGKTWKYSRRSDRVGTLVCLSLAAEREPIQMWWLPAQSAELGGVKTTTKASLMQWLFS